MLIRVFVSSKNIRMFFKEGWKVLRDYDIRVMEKNYPMYTSYLDFGIHNLNKTKGWLSGKYVTLHPQGLEFESMHVLFWEKNEINLKNTKLIINRLNMLTLAEYINQTWWHGT